MSKTGKIRDDTRFLRLGTGSFEEKTARMSLGALAERLGMTGFQPTIRAHV